jgi:hypothetical protein
MSETEQVKGLKIEMVFDEAASSTLSEMRGLAGVNDNVRLLSQAVRFYDWYLRTVKRDGATLITKVGNQHQAITFEF